ncbi:MAG: hypothetical protein EHM61_00940, partial [Acidobacteria bacterium]
MSERRQILAIHGDSTVTDSRKQPMIARDNPTRRRQPEEASLDLRQFIAGLLIVFLALPTSLAPPLLAASDAKKPDLSSSPAGRTSTGDREQEGTSAQPHPVSRQPLAVSSQQISEAALSRQTPALNGGTIEGALRVFEGKNFSLATKFALTGDLFVVGTPTIDLQQGASYAGTVDEGGRADPNYRIQLQKDVQLPGKIHIRTDPVPLPADIPASVPPPAGTRKVTINKAEDVADIGDWKTVRDLTVNAPDLTVDVPAGDYGQFTINGPGVVRFSAGDYNFASGLSLHQKSAVEVGGPGSITLGTSFTSNGGKIRVVSGVKPHQLRVNILGNTVNLSGDATVEALVRAPQAHATLTGETVLVRGQLIADRLTMNAGKIVGDVLPSDTTPPTLQILTPADNAAVYTSKIAVHGLARDEGEIKTAVTSVIVNGVAADFDPESGNWLTTVPLALGDNLITARAADGATPPNIGTAAIHILRQNPGPPDLSLIHPADGAFLATNLVTIAGRATSQSPEVSLSVTVNGQPATLAGSEFTRSVSLVDGPNSITVIAADSLGQTSQKTLSVTCDLRPPQVSLVSLPSVVLPGSSYRITAEASDNYRLASVEFTIDGQTQAQLPAAPFEFTYLVPAGYEPGRRISVSAIAHDASGQVGVDSGETRVAGPSGVAGRVFDDVTGYTLPGVAVVSTDGAAAESATDGGWFFVSPLSLGFARFSKADYTACEREFSLDSGKGAWLLDARLTPIDSHANEIGPAGGAATGDSGRVQATVPANTLTAPLDLRLTAVSPQGLTAVLPVGWSPVPGAVVDFRPANASPGLPDHFSSPVKLLIPPGGALVLQAPAPPLSLARYNESAHGWVVVDPQIQPGSDGSLAADLDRFGQYAFVVPDSGPVVPPAPVRGLALPAGPAAVHSRLENAVAFATASPPTALYGPEAKSTIKVTADLDAKIPSGVWCEASFDERYDLRGQSEPKLVERASQSFVMYAYPAATAESPNRLAASFPAKPTIGDYPLAQFRAANLHVRIRSAEPDPGSLADPTGGTIKASGGVELALPPGALGSPTPVFLKTLSADEIPVLLPEGFEVLGGALVDLSGATLTASARLSMPAFFPETARVVVARVIPAGDRRGLKLVARAVEVNGRLESRVSGPPVPSGLQMPGITEGGTYAFIRLSAPFGYASGTVTRADSSLVSQVRVSADTNPFLDVTSTGGRYLLPAAAGPDFEGLNNLTAASLLSDETGNSVATLAVQDAIVETPILIASVPFSIASVTPSAGAVEIPVSTTIRVAFSKPVSAASVTASSFKLTTLNGSFVVGSVLVAPGNQAATLTPTSALAAGTAYRIDLTTGVLDLYGHPLGAAFWSTFTTAASQPVSGRLTANAVSISYPDATGFVTITIPAGLVPPGSIVIALNQTSGSTSTVTAGTGPLSFRLMASLGDDIRIIVRQPSGVDYEVAQAAFQSPDGFAAVGPNGGTVVSADGTIALVIEPGAIAGLAEIKLTPAPESTITIPRVPGTPMDPANVPFGAGVKIETRGSFSVKKGLHVEVVAPAAAPEGSRAICLAPSKAVDPDTGEEVEVWDSVTSAVVEHGRFKTTSPPFMTLFGMYGIFHIYMFMPRYSHILWGWVTEPKACRPDAKTNDPAFIPVAGVLCVTPSAEGLLLRGQVTARTDPRGLYAMFDVTMAPPTNVVMFIDEVTHRKTYASNWSPGLPPGIANEDQEQENNELLQFLSGLQGFTYANVNGRFPCPSPSSAMAPPVLVTTGRQLYLEPGQDDPLPSHGVARVGAIVEVKVASDQPLSVIEGRVLIGGAAPRPLAWAASVSTSSSTYEYATQFEAPAEGGYLVQVTGTGPGGASTATYQFVVLRDPNVRPPLEGPPFILSVSPKDGAGDVDVTTDIRVEFSEPVRNLVGGGATATVYLEDPFLAKIGGTILSGGITVTPESSVSSIVFKPERSLLGGTTYVFHITVGVVDSNNVALHHGQNTVSGEFTSGFTTYAGKRLYSTPETTGLRIAVDGRYSFVLKPETTTLSTLTVYDTADPTKAPEQRGSLRLPQYGTDLAISTETRYRLGGGIVDRVGVITAVYPLLPDRAASLWILDLHTPETPAVIGVVSLYFPQDLATAPLSVALHNGRAYVGNAPYRGILVVDVQAAIDQWRGLPMASFKTCSEIEACMLALSPNRGYGESAIVQNLLYQSQDPAVPAMANSISVITQNVPPYKSAPAGIMPVAFAVDSGAQAILAAGLPGELDGVLGYLPGEANNDRRILSWVKPANGSPLAVQAVSGLRVGNTVIDAAVVLTSQELEIYDATKHPMTAPLGSALWTELKISGVTNHFKVEGGLAYILSAGGLAVVDLSNATPRRVTLVPDWYKSTSLFVQDGFVHTVSPTGGYAVGIARPVAQVFVHGGTGAEGQLCSNPVILDRNNSDHPMRQPAEVLFQIFGKQAEMQSARVTIRKNDEILKDIYPVEIRRSPEYDLVTGAAIWQSSRIDLTASYTAQVTIDEYQTDREPIPMSFLISDYQTVMQVRPKGALVEQAEVPPYAYVLAANASTTVSVGTGAQQRRSGGSRGFGLNTEELDITGLAVGRYELKLRAELPDGYSEEMVGVLEIAPNPNDVRVPNHTIVGGIDLATGQLGLTYTDVMIKGRGLSLEFTRSYNQATANVFSPLGYGWHHNYQMLLVHNKDLELYTIIGGDAQGESFPEATMRSLAPFHTRLVPDGNGGFDYYNKANIKYHFPGALERDSYSYYHQSYMGNLDYVADGYDNRIDLKYDILGRLTEAADASQRTLRFEYEQALAPFVGVVLPFVAGHTSATCVESGGFPVIRDHFATSSAGKAWRIKRIEGPGGLDITYHYDEDGNLTSVRRSGESYSMTPPEEGKPGIESQSTPDYVWDYEYKPERNGSVPAENLTHLLKKVTSPNQISTPQSSTTYEFIQDNFGLPISVVRYPEGVANSFAYTFDGVKIQSVDVTDGKGIPTQYTLDREKVVSMTVAGATTRFVYDHEKGLKIAETDPEDMVRCYYHDNNGNVIKLEQSGGETGIVTRAQFDLTFNRPLKRWDANSGDETSGLTSYTLNPAGDVAQIQFPDHSTMRFEYDGLGQLLKVTDRLGLVTRYADYDAYGNPEQIIQETERDAAATVKTIVTKNSWDALSRLVLTSAALGPTLTHSYDKLDRVVETVTTDPSETRTPLTVSYKYQIGGQLTEEIKTTTITRASPPPVPQTHTIKYKYDALDRRVAIEDGISGGPGYTRSYEYDANSNLVFETNRRGIGSRYTYNDQNFLLRHEIFHKQPDEAWVLKTVEAVVSADKVGNPLTVTDRYGNTTTLQYDGLHRLTGRKLGGYNETWVLDGNGNIEEFTDRNGHKTTFEYEELNRVKLRTDPKGRRTTWTYQVDRNRDVTTMTQSLRGLRVVTERDALDRPLLEQIFCSSYTVTPGSPDPDTPLYATRWTYTDDKGKVEVLDPRGKKTTKLMSAFGEVKSIELGRNKTTKKYTGLGGLYSLTNGRNREWTYELDGFNRVLVTRHPETDPTRAPPDQITESFAYDEEGNLKVHVNRRGITTSQTYDHLGRVLTRTVGEFQVDRFAYDDPAHSVTRTDGNSNSTVFHYDALGRLDSVKNAEGATKSFTWDGVNLVAETDFKGVRTDYRYDEVDRLASITDRLKHLTKIDYLDGYGVTRTTTDRNGNQRVEIFDGLDRLVHVDWGGKRFAHYEYDGNDNLKKQSDGEERWVAYEYTDENWVSSAAHGGLRTERFEYDEAGNLISYSDGEGEPVEQKFDGLNRVITRKDGEGNLTEFENDGELLRKRIDPLEHQTQYEYDDLGSLTQVKDALQQPWTYRYDQAQNLVVVRDPEDVDGNRETRFTYDSVNRVETVTSPLARQSTYDYDANSNLTLRIDPKTQSRTTVYDAEDQPDFTTISSGAQLLKWQYHFDPEGNLVKLEETVGGPNTPPRTYTRGYDERNRLKQAMDPYDRSIAFEYDRADNVVSFVDSKGRTTGYAYDAANRLSDATLPGDQPVGLEWRADNLLGKVRYPGGMLREYGYDEANRITSVKNQISPTEVEQFGYVYDKDSNRVSETRQFNAEPARQLTYRYDELERLTQAAYSGRTVDYKYDKVGNREAEIGQAPSGEAVNRTYTCNDANQLTEVNDIAVPANSLRLTYDPNGNLATEQSPASLRTFEHDGADRLVKVSVGDQVAGTYDYDFQGRRISRATATDVTQYTYRGDSIQVSNEYDRWGQLTGAYYFASDLVRAELTEGQRWYFHDALG